MPISREDLVNVILDNSEDEVNENLLRKIAVETEEQLFERVKSILNYYIDAYHNPTNAY